MRLWPAALPLLVACASQSRVPDVLRQGAFLHPQAVSGIDVGPDGAIAVATMAFRHENNFWLLSDDGKILSGRNVLPWAPFQSALLPGGKAFAVGLAYSRVTPPNPTIALFANGEETALVDNAGDVGLLRYGSGPWRTGWLASLLGDLQVRAGDYVYTVASNDGPFRMDKEGRREKVPLKYPRPFRMAASADGRRLACGYLAAEAGRAAKDLVVMMESASAKIRWVAAPMKDAPPPPSLPDPAAEFPEMAADFRLGPDAVTSFRVAASIALNADGSRVAVTEYGGRLWIRQRPAIGKWDPPYHLIPFVHRQRGRLRVFGEDGRELESLDLPREGLFEVHSSGDSFVCAPMSWFARGMGGLAWRPADDKADTIYTYDRQAWTEWRLPDAVADVAVHGHQVLASCWDGWLYLSGRRVLDAGGPARVRWSADGRLAVAGTENGEVIGVGPDGALRWRVKLPVTEPPPLKEPPKPVFEGVPVYSVGRVGPEHAYVGDLWLVKTAEGGFMVDAGGASSVPFSLQRIRGAGVDPMKVSHLLHSHSHGDHCGGAYLWRAMGLKITAPATADLALAWLMPTLSDYGVWPPRPVDVPLPLKKAGDEAEFEIGGVRIRAVFVPGHSFDAVVYMMELGGKRVIFTGDIGFEKQDLVHRCWGDAAKAKVVAEVVRSKVLSFQPDFVFTGHGPRPNGTAFLEDLLQRSDESIREAASRK
jgi:glyoxylase-like metal-dependent hydrolase (beta-lactamase superfamily II)